LLKTPLQKDNAALAAVQDALQDESAQADAPVEDTQQPAPPA
jgi:hypothetical protein